MAGETLGKFRIAAEWEPQEAVYLAIGPGDEIDAAHFSNGTCTVEDVQVEMVRALQDVVMVRIIVNCDSETNTFQQAMKAAGLGQENVEFLIIPHGDIWVRDTGPIWRIEEDGSVALTWFGFNNWGYLPYIEGEWAHSDIPNMLPKNLGIAIGKSVVHISMIGEGGNKSFNGKGSLICCKAVEKDRNPRLELVEIENALEKYFNVSNIIWVEEGLADDTQTFRVRPEYRSATLPGGLFTPLCTGGHVDEYCRFVGPKKVVLACVYDGIIKRGMSENTAITHYRMGGNLALLQEAKDQDGEKLEILQMPLPPEMIYMIDQRDPIYEIIKDLRGIKFEGPINIVLAASYCNYLVCNGVILFPQYYRKGMDPMSKKTDKAALDVIVKAFPKHEIRLINPMPVNAGGGGMHCISNNQPKPQKPAISRQSIFG